MTHANRLIATTSAESQASADSASLAGSAATPGAADKPMPELGEGRLARLLSRYYAKGLGGLESWQRLNSIRISGEMEVEGAVLQLKAFQKKPDYMKLELVPPVGPPLTLGYDGKQAWKQTRARPDATVPMEAEEARRFVHNAQFGSYLLYPKAPGKHIEFVDTVPTDGAICHQIRVTLGEDYRVDYFIDIRSFRERKVVNKDLKTGMTNTLRYESYKVHSGIPLARVVHSETNGKWVSTLRVETVTLNAGLMPWMFSMPEVP